MPSMLIRHHAMYYQDVGSGFPILFGHSYLWDRKMWQPQVEYLSKYYRCIVPDLWSHGFSEECPQRPYSLEQLSEDYHYLMKSLEIKEYGIIGLSVGGMWGAQLAINHPDAVKALVLMDTFVGHEPEQTKQLYFNLLADLEKAQRFSEEIVQQITPFFFSEYTLKNKPQVVQAFQSSLKQTPHERLAGVVELGQAIFSRGSILHRLKELKMPTLIACGSEDKPRPPSESEQMHREIKGSIFNTIGDAGHIPSIEQPMATTELLMAFLEKAIAQQVEPAA